MSEAVLARAAALLSTGRSQEALDQLGTLPAAEATGSVAMQLRCAALGRLDRWPEVGEAARAGLSASGPDPGLLLWLARFEREAGRPQVAERALLDGLALAPDDLDLLCAYAELCLADGQVEKASRLAELAAARDPHAPTVFATRIQVAHAAGDDRLAQRISQEFVAEYPENPAAHALLGGTSAARGQIGAAYAGFRQAAAGAPTEQSFADTALELKAAQHPLLIPLRPVVRFGAIRTWLTVVAVIFGLRAVGLSPIAAIVAVLWVVFCVYSWVVPPLVRRWVRRQWG